MTRYPLLALALLSLTACSPSGSQGGGEPATVQVSGAVCRPTPVGRQMTGCYLTLTFQTSAPVEVTATVGQPAPGVSSAQP